MEWPVLIAALAVAASEPAEHVHDAPAAHEHDHAHAGGLMGSVGEWMIHAHGFANAVYDHQGGHRGDDKQFSNSMLMTRGARAWEGGTLELRGMFSLDPAMGKGGYPLLFQTGETANGRVELIDRQHPHDAFMELALRYERPFGEDRSWFAYAGLPGEPALGPPTFMHRLSGIRIPEAPISHHWLDSTHITSGVVTLGAQLGDWTLEGSAFNGRESDQYRWNIETGSLNSASARITWSPAPGWSLQASHGDIHDPDAALDAPLKALRIVRDTASVIYEGNLAGLPWATTLAWGRNDRTSTHYRYKLPAWLLETTLDPVEGHAAFLRAERITHDESSIPLSYAKVSVGYIVDVLRTGPVRWGVGALASYLDPAEVTRFFYGDHPHAYMVFVQARL